MARLITQGINAGLLSGRIGDVVYVAKNGQNHIRRMAAKPSKNAFSSVQEQQQIRFKMASKIACQLLPFFRKGHPELMSGHYPLLMKQLLKLLKADNPTTLDWSALQLSKGRIKVKFKAQIIKNQLQMQLLGKELDIHYQFIFLHQESNQVFEHCSRSSEWLLSTPEMEGNYHLFLFGIKGDKSDCSPTFYLGELQCKNDKVEIA